MRTLRQAYHYLLQLVSAVLSGFPARRMVVIGIGGTKGKSTVSEMVFAILREAGYTPALVGTIRFAVGDESRPNRMKMTMPGRGFIQRFLARAARSGATHAVVELTTEGARQYRHLHLFLDVLVMTNVQREHIESHGSFEKYVERKWEIVHELERSPKQERTMITNTDDEWNASFTKAAVPYVLPYSIDDIPDVVLGERSVRFTYQDSVVTLPLPGVFNAVNALAALKVAEALKIPNSTAIRALEKLTLVRGRVEHVSEGQAFDVVVDYAHTPDSLRALYGAFSNRRKIGILGNTGGGRDGWKRPEMGRIVDEMCDEVILTNEDPYDEDPRAIVDAMALGMKRQPLIVMDRREAIRTALLHARPGDVVLISGKGTDPYIMGPRGSREPWDDATVVREELHRLLGTKD
jgi:UDP-N-acetylmuramoyl-L-alanyl-D-glutamate--2,6-diaminopimelate ligase